ncbi:unnamed protein product [Prunus brigantina]
MLHYGSSVAWDARAFFFSSLGCTMASLMWLQGLGFHSDYSMACLATRATRPILLLFFFLSHFQKWRATYASVIPNDMHVKLVESSIDNPPCVDPNDPDARIITFYPFYFSLGFSFRLSKFFRKVLCSMECAPSQCTLNVYQAIMCFENLSSFFKLELTVSANSGKVRSAMFYLFPSFTAMKTQVRTAPSSFAKVKHLVSANSKKIGGMRNVRDTPLKYPTDKFRNCNLSCREVCSQTSSPAERQRDIDIPPQISSRLHRSKDEDRTGRTTLPPNNCDPVV